MKLPGKKIHMVGIGGIGMSGLASILVRMGCKISGSDLVENDLTRKLRLSGVKIHLGHNLRVINNQDIVVLSSCIRSDNPEVRRAKELGIRVISRIKLLKIVMEKNEKVIAVTGTHGKTTITAMTSLLAERAGLDPTVIIGGESPHFNGNAKLGKGDLLIAEVDESDGRFPILRPSHIIIPNLEKEHLEHYRNEKHLEDTFLRFLKAQLSDSFLFYREEDERLARLSKVFKGKKTSFGFSKRASLRASDIDINVSRARFSVLWKNKKIGNIILHIPGVHNILNALAVTSFGLEFGIDFSVIANALSSYRNAKRRFEVIGGARGAKIVEDYAHHPTEIKATIQAAHSLRPKRVIAVFQPHRYSRTKSFYKEFSNSFTGSSEVVLTNVYAASENRLRGASSKRIYDQMLKNTSIPVKLLSMNRIPYYISKIIKKGDLVLVLGAGDIGSTSKKILKVLK